MSEHAEGDLDIREAVSAPPVVNNDGTVQMHLIRPCVGRGKGRHVYEADMLARNAGVFSGWKMFLDHENEGERRSRGGLPRSVKDIGGVVLESHWDPSVPAEGRFGAGAVVGTVRPIKQVGDLVALHPSLVESSINARATGVRAVQREGGKAWLVEGIEPTGSVDWVTEGGAGGKVVSLSEAAFDGTEEEQEMALLEALTDDELRDYLQQNRPAVLAEASDGGDGDKDDWDGMDTSSWSDGAKAHYKKMRGKGMPPKVAAAAAKRITEAETEPTAPTPDPKNAGGDTVPVTKEDIEEAVLQSDDVKTLITDLVESTVSERLQTERAQIRAEAYADAARQIELRDLRDTAATKIREAKLPATFTERAIAQYSITDDGPSAALNVFESYDDEGNITKSAEATLLEGVAETIADYRLMLAEANPTRVTRQGPQGPAGDGKEGGDAPKRDLIGPLTRELFEASDIDPDKAFDSELRISA